MAKATRTKTVEPAEAQEPAQQPQAPKRMFIISEDSLNTLFTQFQELPYKIANPLIGFLQKSLQEVAPEQVKGEGA